MTTDRRHDPLVAWFRGCLRTRRRQPGHGAVLFVAGYIASVAAFIAVMSGLIELAR